MKKKKMPVYLWLSIAFQLVSGPAYRTKEIEKALSQWRLLDSKEQGSSRLTAYVLKTLMSPLTSHSVTWWDPHNNLEAIRVSPSRMKMHRPSSILALPCIHK